MNEWMYVLTKKKQLSSTFSTFRKVSPYFQEKDRGEEGGGKEEGFYPPVALEASKHTDKRFFANGKPIR